MKHLQFLGAALIAFYTSISPAISQEQDIVLDNIQVWPNASGNNVIRITTPTQSIVNNWACADPDSYMVLSTIEKEAQARIFATLLTAKAANKPVTIRVQGCELGRPAIISVYL